MRELYWLQHDLRLQDNPGLLSHCAATELLLVYIWQEPQPWCNLRGVGAQRRRLLLEHLGALRGRLQELGQDLLFLEGRPEQILPALVQQLQIERVGTSRSPGTYETRTLEQLRDRLPVPLQVHGGNTLLPQTALPMSLDEMPRHFTPFRRALESVTAASVVPAPLQLPPPPAAVRYHALPEAAATPPAALPIRGGSQAGQRRLHQFIFGEQRVLDYRNTRNCLDPLDGSSTLSPWLASGALSAREVASSIAGFEQQHEGNDSTQALYLELLWREFFHWRALADGHRLFRSTGSAPQSKHRFCTFEPRAFARWCQGDTDFPLVNALIRQLLATGWMSNRGRQIAASCLINELGLDWRYGAAFFEKHLIDYDVGSNYGNWQYIAGVGADPRGGRHFNLAKQAAEHDPDGLFTAKWGGNRPSQPLYVTDAADWPMMPGDNGS
ncbi:DASH family cryptochrome [Kineobactrum sediminis]|uniref:Cryptochrome DASH n=1 Tax=Kineobactrum sediminis TaxID=1905677 RepID=A0A2N5XYE2_9GAMM|nr:DASH family cryptochrome [Kineobactrum sediminis]PLW81165.1 DASH family cryptochrome [Kineobactrum sediminis]